MIFGISFHLLYIFCNHPRCKILARTLDMIWILFCGWWVWFIFHYSVFAWRQCLWFYIHTHWKFFNRLLNLYFTPPGYQQSYPSQSTYKWLMLWRLLLLWEWICCLFMEIWILRCPTTARKRHPAQPPVSQISWCRFFVGFSSFYCFGYFICKIRL